MTPNTNSVSAPQPPNMGNPVGQSTAGLQPLIEQFGLSQVSQAISSAYSAGFLDSFKSTLLAGGAPKALVDDLLGRLSNQVVESPALRAYMQTPQGMESMKDGINVGNMLAQTTLSEQGYKAAGGADDSRQSKPPGNGMTPAPRPPVMNPTPPTAAAPPATAPAPPAAAPAAAAAPSAAASSGAASSDASGYGSWLFAIAKALAKVQMQMADKLKSATDALSNSTADENNADFLENQAKVQASAQLFKSISETVSTVIKTLGEGMQAVARKQ